MNIAAAKRSGVVLLALTLFFALKPARVAAQANSEIYGQNRIQYRKFDWKFFDTRHFRIYYYDRSGMSLARYVAEQAERDLPNIERRMGGTFPKRFNILLYNNFDEYRQTNVGLKYESQTGDIPAGIVNIQGDRLVVYFDGIHTDLRRQIRLGMTRVVLERLLLGDNLREQVKNTFLLNTPLWVTDGYISYLVDGWDEKSESLWKNVLDASPKSNFYELSDRYPELAGKAFYKYTNDRYGESTIRSLLYTIQGRSSLNQGVKLTYGKKVSIVYDSLLAYYHDAFAKDALVQETPPLDSSLISISLPKHGGVIKSMRLSPRGHDVAYCEFKEGEYRVYIQHTDKEQTRSQIIYEGQKDYNEQTPDPDFPIMAWSNNGYKLALVFRRGRQTRLRIYDSRRARIENHVIPPNRFDRVMGMAFNEDNDRIVFSAIKKSQTDLYEFTIRGNRMTNITNDVWDDVQPQFISGGSRRGILFMSNRPKPQMTVPAEVNELPTGPMNLYFYDTKTQSNTLLQCTYNKAGGNITQPIQYGPDNFAYLLDTNGIQNTYVISFVRKAGNLDSATSSPVNNYSRSVLSHQYNPDGRQIGDVLQIGEDYKVFYHPLRIPGEGAAPKTLVPTTLSRSTSPYLAPSYNSGKGLENDMPQAPAVKRGNAFKTEFSDTTFNYGFVSREPQRDRNGVAVDTSLLLNPTNKDSTYLKLKAQPYRLSFKPDFFTLRLDNTVLFSKYQSVATNGGSLTNPPLSGLFTVSLNDALENHRFTGGIRLPASFSGITYFLQYQNFKNRIDWSALYLRTANLYVQDVPFTLNGQAYLAPEVLNKSVINLLQGSASYPLDRVRRLAFHLGLRQDVLTYKAADSVTLSVIDNNKDNKQYWALSRLEYVFDNSRQLAVNLREGFRYKAYGEYLLGLSNQNKGGFYNFGLDFRYYKPLYKNTIFATRIAAAHSAGNQHILYFLGGVDNWISPKYASYAPIAGDQHYAFQSLATNLRGYEQNARNGNTYAVANLELRFPVLTTLIRKPIQSSFLRNLQLVGFADGGSAWNGLLPNIGDSKKTATYYTPPVLLSINLPNADGFALGYGAGLRSTLLGYFMRLDAAWNIEGRTKPIWYFSIGTDF